MASICRARLLSDLSGQAPCDKEATSVDGRLCSFHSRQCQALYRGYKKRNAELDALSNAPPAYLTGKKASVAAQDFTDLKDEATLRELHNHLFRRYNLLDRVIRARKLHHSHFFAIDNDYGHQKYLDRLQNDRLVMSKALDRLGKQVAAVMYEQKQWFDWVKHCQDEEEKQGENESKKVKLESLLFQRHQKEIQRHQREMRAKEDEKRQEQFLDQTYQQRLSEMSEEEQDDWDPIKDVYGYERDSYVDLIKYFLMLKTRSHSDAATLEVDTTEAGPSETGKAETKPSEKPLSKSAKKRLKKSNAETKKMADLSMQNSDGRSGVIEMETREQMRERLSNPVKFERSTGWYIAGVGGPTGLETQTPTLPADEIEQLLREVAEIKVFLLCRILLTQSTLLPVAVQSDSVEEFLTNPELTRENLRDLCLKLERPQLQDVRDACADFIRERDGVEDLEELEPPMAEADEYGEVSDIPKKYQFRLKSGHMPETYQTKREESATKKSNKKGAKLDVEADGPLDFGKVTDESQYKRKRTRIKICGRYMYDYPSEKALNRGGWFHFSIIAKDSDLFDAVELCRNWNEFFELNILCLYNYFPAPKWARFIGDLPRQQLLQLGFIPYFIGDKAEKITNYAQTGSRGMARRSHSVTEMRNFICGHIKRDDPVSRRFIQYLAMETFELRAVVRDRKTGRVLITPPDEELWLLREKSGWGRATRNEFDVIGEVGPVFFEQMDKSRKWHFGFKEYYDVYIWDSAPGRSFFLLQRKIEEVLTRAMRVHDLKDMFSTAGPILKTLTKDPVTDRVRSIQHDEEVESIWDGLDKNARAWSWSPTAGMTKEGFDDSYKYTEADELEDQILFPQETNGGMKDNLFRQNANAMEIFEREPIDIRSFAQDLDTDCESDAYDESDMDDSEYEKFLDNLEDDDGDLDWEDEEIPSEFDRNYEYMLGGEKGAEENDDVARAVDIATAQLKKDQDYFLGILRDPQGAKAKLLPASVREKPEDLMGTLRWALRCQQEYNHSTQGMEADFYRHLDRQKSKVFKQSWHTGDQEPGALMRYLEHRFMVDAMDCFTMETGINPGPFELCQFMKMAPDFREERRIVDDAFTAHACIAMFFETEAFLSSEYGKQFEDSKLLNQAERAKTVPNRRTHKSNKTMPKEFWDDFDKLLKDNKRHVGDAIEDIFPMEWRKVLRPLIIRMFRAGVICTSYGNAAGAAVAKAEPGREMDLYIDYREGIPLSRIVSHLQDPTPLDRDFLVKYAKKYTEQHASAKFSVLRLWSSPHFYPLMLGYERRPMCSFLDDRGRCWEWKFIPKDMPFSEWSVHQQLTLRLEPYKGIFGSQVLVAKDLVLVMGRDAKNLRQLSEGVTWAIQTKPWRLEVDFWRSFVNVDAGFLEGLPREWLD